MPTTLSRQSYLLKNICPTCKCRKLKSGYHACEICIEANYKWAKANRARVCANNKKRYDMLKSQSLCVQCTKPTEGNVYCKACVIKNCRTRTYKGPRHSRNRWSKR